MEQNTPGLLKRARYILMTAWLPLRQYAPEMAGAFLELEKLSRSPGQEATFPTMTVDELRESEYERRSKLALSGDHQNDAMINSAISQCNFDKARKLVAKLTDEVLKSRAQENINMYESISMARRGDVTEADRLAQRLNNATSILAVYPLIIDRCVENKNESYAAALVYQAVEQIKRANNEPSKPPTGIPAFAVATNSEVDPALFSLGELVKSISPINEALALFVLDEMVLTSNHSKLDTRQGRVGFDASIFKSLSWNSDARVRQAAGNFDDPLRQIISFASIAQGRAEKLMRQVGLPTVNERANATP